LQTILFQPALLTLFLFFLQSSALTSTTKTIEF
jgi:hypothetical protein